MKLSIELSKWRCDRPDEWKMDEFIRNAEKLEAERNALAVYCNELFRVLNQLNAQAERSLYFDIGNYHALKGASCAADNALDKTPQQHLAAHDAEVAAKAIEDAAKRLMCGWVVKYDDLLEYADELRSKK